MLNLSDLLLNFCLDLLLNFCLSFFNHARLILNLNLILDLNLIDKLLDFCYPLFGLVKLILNDVEIARLLFKACLESVDCCFEVLNHLFLFLILNWVLFFSLIDTLIVLKMLLDYIKYFLVHICIQVLSKFIQHRFGYHLILAIVSIDINTR